jgi:hypothetical protein
LPRCLALPSLDCLVDFPSLPPTCLPDFETKCGELPPLPEPLPGPDVEEVNV